MARPITRRKALGLGMHAAGAATLVAGIATAQRRTDHASGATATSEAEATPVALAPELLPPPVLQSEHGELNVTTIARLATVSLVGVPQQVTTYTFDGVVPAHTWEVRPGDTLRVNMANELPDLPEVAHVDLTRPHEWTTTNLHVHGLHVDPGGDSDNVFISIPPGTNWNYTIDIPANHPAGLFWWHPHRHGAVAQQVRGGMAGAIIVRGDIDEVPEIAAAKEQVLVMQALELGDDYQLMDPIPYPTKEQAFYPRTQILYTVNGMMNPRITMYPGEVQRWRLLNAAEGKFMSLQLAGHDFNVIAWDGLTLDAPEAETTLLLSAGNRAEVLVQAGAPGIYDLVLTPGSSQKPNIPGMPQAAGDATPMPRMAHEPGQLAPAAINATGELAVRPILRLEVTGDGPEMSLPSALPAWDPPMPPISRRREVIYSVTRDPDDEFIDFGINGLPFDPTREPYTVPVNTAEEWTIINGADHKLADHAHVFHIHVNPFKITWVNGQRLEKPLWRDTFVLTGKTGDSFTFETHFADFVGKFVEHCHVLTHEDLGMMEAIEVVAAAADTTS